MISIKNAASNFEREPLVSPFGFKGGYIDELWQTVAGFEDNSGRKAVSVGVQSTLWSDPAVFVSMSQAAGNAAMHMITEKVLRHACGNSYRTPFEYISDVLPAAMEYGKKITGINNLRKTFALNALVAPDNAMWLLFAAAKGAVSFDQMIPEEFHPALMERQDRLLCIPLVSYGVSADQISRLINNGHSLLKIKIGADPDGDGDRSKMLSWDKKRLEEVHLIARDMHTPHTESGRIPYYLDANGRYDSRGRLEDLLDFAGKIGALENILLLEEPFSEDSGIDVSGLPVRIAADESAHSAEDVAERIQMGYGAIALKPIAKTLSMSLLMQKEAYARGVPCFCADLTVNPLLVAWNMNFAARLKPVPGMKTGVFESNGAQNYRNWQQMKIYHPASERQYTEQINSIYRLDEAFYKESGGIFGYPKHYASLLGWE